MKTKKALRILSIILIVFATFMAVRQGYAMITAQPEMIALFTQWDFTETGIQIIGVITISAALLLLHAKTFVVGNVLMAAGVLLLIVFELMYDQYQEALIEVPFLLLNLVLLYLGHPYGTKMKSWTNDF